MTTRVDVSLNPNTIKIVYLFNYFRKCGLFFCGLLSKGNNSNCFILHELRYSFPYARNVMVLLACQCSGRKNYYKAAIQSRTNLSISKLYVMSFQTTRKP